MVATQAPEVKRLKRSITARKRLNKKLTAEERKYSRDLEKAIKRAVAKWGNIYRLPLWPVFLEESREPIKSGIRSNPQSVAQVRLLDEHNQVHIIYSHKLKPEAIDRIIAHEMAHWVLKSLWLFLYDVLNSRDWRVARRLMESALENFVIALLQPSKAVLFDPLLEEEEDGR